jgi:uncharacterized membrane protein SirB2
LINQQIHNFALWLDSHQWSTMLHESFYMYNWVEATHVLSLMLSLGMLFIIDLRMLGLALSDIPASKIADKLSLPMFFGFSLMVITGCLLFYAIPVRSSQSVWLRLKLLLLLLAVVNAFLFHRKMSQSVTRWDMDRVAPLRLRVGASVSLCCWVLVVIFGRFIAYDWYDCSGQPSELVSIFAGCIDGQVQF